MALKGPEAGHGAGAEVFLPSDEGVAEGGLLIGVLYPMASPSQLISRSLLWAYAL